MTTKIQTRKARGKALEDWVSGQLRSKGLDPKATRSAGSGSGTRDKADIVTSTTILGRNLGIECKNHKNAAVKDWWKQACKLEVLGMEPMVVYRLAQESYEDTKVILRLDTLLDLLKRASEPKTVESSDRQFQWDLKTLKQSAHKVIKHLEQ